jgi:hypothetical protein
MLTLNRSHTGPFSCRHWLGGPSKSMKLEKLMLLTFDSSKMVDAREPTPQCIASNALNLGRLRSLDYQMWMPAYVEHYHRWPFYEEVWTAVGRDMKCFVRTYKVEKLNHCSDTTLEMKPYERKTLTVERRNHMLRNLCQRTSRLLHPGASFGWPLILKRFKDEFELGCHVWEGLPQEGATQ